EFVLYPLGVVRAGTTEPGFLLNLNTGARMDFRLDLEADAAEAHWFAIDRSILAAHGIAISGPPARELFTAIPPAAIMPLLAAALDWHRRRVGRADDAVLNAARALRYVTERRWSDKAAAGRWAAGRLDDPQVILRAVDARTTGEEMSWDEAVTFVAAVE